MVSRKMNRKSRKASRKSKASRKGKASRKSGRKGRRCWGGAYNPMELSLRQGQQFNEQHVNQHGGANSLYGAPVGDQGLLPAELRDMARITPLDGQIRDASVMRDPDQNGGVNGHPTMIGGRRRGRKSRKSRKSSRKSRKNKQRGGAMRVMGSPYDAPSMLLDDKSMTAGSGTQNGGRRKGSRSASRKGSRSASRKGSKSRKSRKGSRKSRKNKQRGGAHMWGSPIDAPNMLLTEAEAREAGTGDFSNPLMKN